MQLRAGSLVLEPVTDNDVEEMIPRTLSTTAQGPFKRVPAAASDSLRQQFLTDPDRRYFYIVRGGHRVGRVYFRRWQFVHHGVDWELNTLVADPNLRGQGIGTDAKRAAIAHLVREPHTLSIWAYTYRDNVGAQKSLERGGLGLRGLLSTARYPVPVPEDTFLLYSLELHPPSGDRVRVDPNGPITRAHHLGGLAR